MPYSTFLIDLDHTLFDSETSERAALARALALAGIDDADGHYDDYARINLAHWDRVERGELTPQQVKTARFVQLLDLLGIDADADPIAEEYVLGLAANGELYTGARAALESLAAHARLALVTNGLSEVQRARIERTGIAPYFDAVVISAEVGAAKPAAAIFDIAFERLGSPDKSGSLMVGDNLASDIRGGSDYGIATCWYNPHGRRAGRGHRISHEIRRLDELPAYGVRPA